MLKTLCKIYGVEKFGNYVNIRPVRVYEPIDGRFILYKWIIVMKDNVARGIISVWSIKYVSVHTAIQDIQEIIEGKQNHRIKFIKYISLTK